MLQAQQQNAEMVQELQRQLEAALAELESMPKSATVPGQELLGQVVQIKVNGVTTPRFRVLLGGH